MNLSDGLKKESTITNTKGGKYYKSTWDANLDLFTIASRGTHSNKLITLFEDAYEENREFALANLLYILDIKDGKGERRMFKVIYKYLCNNYYEDALIIMPLIGSLGRYDLVLQGLHTRLDNETVEYIKTTLDKDIKSSNPSLLAKWLPSLRTHNRNSSTAKYLAKRLELTEKEYRKILKSLRDKLNIVEKPLTLKEYNSIDFEKVPTKAMLKYNRVFNKKIHNKYEEYKESVKKNNKKINTKGLYVYDIVRNVLNNKTSDLELLDLMWNNQIDFLKGNKSNILVMADTSGSMTEYNNLPLSISIGLAIYIAERNYGIFHNEFMSFSFTPTFQKIHGKNIIEKIKNIECIIDCTDIDAAFELLLNTAIKYNLKSSDMPKAIIIISDMEFDQGVYSKNDTNLSGWKEAFEANDYKLPSIIFWNVAIETNGTPITRYDEDVCLVSGFSTNILDHLLDLDEYNPTEVMKEKLNKYLKLLEKSA